MIEKGSRVRLKGMEYEYPHGFNKKSQNGQVGEVIRATTVTNIHYGDKHTVTVLKMKDSGEYKYGIDSRNLEEVE